MAKKLFSKDKTTLPPNKPNCAECKLCDVAKSPNLKFIGAGRTGVLIITDSPSLEEDEKGEYGRGKNYVFLESTLEDMGYDLEKDFYLTSSQGCRLPRNRAPTSAEMQHCLPRLNNIIKRLQPKAVILLGATPFNTLIEPLISEGRMTGLTASNFYGDTIPDQKLGYWVCPTWGISELLSTKTYDDGATSKPFYLRDKAVMLRFCQHIRHAVEKAQTPFPIYETPYKITDSIDQAVEWIEEALDWDFVALDYETNCRKPHKEGRIFYASISNGRIAYSFPFFNDTFFLKIWKKLLSSKSGKIAHNNQFEATWTKVRGGGFWITNWIWDTMLAMHCINNTKRTNLKYCVYRTYGICGYDSEADQYIVPKASDTKKYGAYALNKIHEAPPAMMEKYNALDSLFTAWLYKDQKRELSEFQLEGLKLLVDTGTTLAKVSENGLLVAEEQFAEVDKMLNESLEETYKEILEMDDVKRWDGEEPLNLNSPKQLSHLLFDILKVKPIGYTDKTRTTPSTDKESLIKMNRPFLRKLIEYREFKKMVSTYIEGYKKETVDGYVHSSFNLNTVDTFRSSSDSPNVQVAYKRDKKKKKIVRSLIKAEPGCVIVEHDFHSLEVIVNGCHSNDPSLVKYCTDPSTDMHSDGTQDALVLKPEEVTKDYRGACKGLYIFAEFYGSYYVQVAQGLWDYAQGIPALMEHLKKCKLGEYSAFEKHIEACEKKLWGERFKKHAEWRREQWNTYQKKGYLESFTGFRLQCPMSKNNSFNGKVQGDGFHCLCYMLNKMQAKIEELGLRTKIVNEIHDSMVLMVPVEEEHLIDYWMYEFLQQLMKEWTWITIPLTMEKERSKVGGTWAEMDNCGYLNGGLCLPKEK